MKKRVFSWMLMLAVALTASSAVVVERNDVEQARNLAGRLSQRLLDKVEFVRIDAEQGKDVFTLEGRDGKVVIEGVRVRLFEEKCLMLLHARSLEDGQHIVAFGV